MTHNIIWVSRQKTLKLIPRFHEMVKSDFEKSSPKLGNIEIEITDSIGKVIFRFVLINFVFYEFNPYWQITETKSKTWEFTERHLRKQNPKNFQKFHFGNVTERHLRKQNPDKNTEYLVIIFIFLRFLGSSPSVIYGNKIQWNFPKES